MIFKILNQIFHLSFNDYIPFKKIRHFHDYLYSFLMLVNFRRNLPFSKIELYAHDNESFQKLIGEVFFPFNQEQYDRHTSNSVLLEDIKDDFTKLLQFVGENEDFICRYCNYFIPYSTADARRIDSVNFFSMALSFEGIYKKFAKNELVDDLHFINAKNDILGLITKYFKEVESSQYSIQQKKDIKAQLQNYSDKISNVKFYLQRQFDGLVEKNKDVLDNLLSKIKQTYIPIIKGKETTFGAIFNMLRNDIAHGDLEANMNVDYKKTYFLGVALIYIVILKKAKLSDASIKLFIDKLITLWAF